MLAFSVQTSHANGRSCTINVVVVKIDHTAKWKNITGKSSDVVAGLRGVDMAGGGGESEGMYYDWGTGRSLVTCSAGGRSCGGVYCAGVGVL